MQGPRSVRIEQLTTPTAADVSDLDALLPQLSGSAHGDVDWSRLAAGPTTTVLVARSEQGIVGMLTVVTFEIPTGRRCFIEDVVVAERARGRGVGGALVDAALAAAAARGVATVDLTSRPSRVEANRLYERAGFARRETNVWRYTFDS